MSALVARPAQLRLQFPCSVTRDPRGVPCGPAYRPMLVAGWDNTIGTGWNTAGLKAGRTMQCLSTLERTAVYRFELDPAVLDIREQYPIYDPDRLGKLLATRERRIARNEVATLDFVLTRLDPQTPSGCRYQAVSVKHVADLGRKSVQRRLEREQLFCQQQGWHWTLMTEREVTKAQAVASRAICRMATGIDLEALREPARKVADLLRRRPPTSSLQATGSFIQRTLGTLPEQAMHLIAAAVLYGYIALDLRQPLNLRSPLVLATTRASI